MQREVIVLGKNTYIVEESAPKYNDWYICGNNVFRHALPGWGSQGHGEAKTILASTRTYTALPEIKKAFLDTYKSLDKKGLNKILSDDNNFMYVHVQETQEEACARCFEEMRASNPTGGLREFVRIAVNFGVEWGKNNPKKS